MGYCTATQIFYFACVANVNKSHNKTNQEQKAMYNTSKQNLQRDSFKSSSKGTPAIVTVSDGDISNVMVPPVACQSLLPWRNKTSIAMVDAMGM